MLLDEIATFLASSLSLTVGTDIFKGSMPATPDACVTIIEYGGVPPQHTFGTDHAIQMPRFQVVCRGARDDYSTPRTTAKSVYAALHFTNQTLSAVRYLRCEAIDEPFPLMQDENGRWHIACNYSVWKDFS